MKKLLTAVGALLFSIASFSVVADVSELELKVNDIVIASVVDYGTPAQLDTKTETLQNHREYLTQFLWDQVEDNSYDTGVGPIANTRSSGGGLVLVTIVAQHAERIGNHVPRYVNPSGKFIS